MYNITQITIFTILHVVLHLYDSVPFHLLPRLCPHCKLLINIILSIMLLDRCSGRGQLHGGDIAGMPLDWMPFGLTAHNLKFFGTSQRFQPSSQDDYRSWCQSMYTLFGKKWPSMHLVPLWSYDIIMINIKISD